MKITSLRATLAVKMAKDNILKRILEEEDFVHAPKFGNSLNKFLAKNEKVVNNREIAKLLLLDEGEVERLYEESVVLLRTSMVGEEDS